MEKQEIIFEVLQATGLNWTVNNTFTLDEITKIVNNWSMCRIDEGDILRFYEEIKK